MNGLPRCKDHVVVATRDDLHGAHMLLQQAAAVQQGGQRQACIRYKKERSGMHYFTMIIMQYVQQMASVA